MRSVLFALALVGAVLIGVGVAVPFINPQTTLDMQSRVNVYWGCLAGGGLLLLSACLVGLAKLAAADQVAAAIRDAAARGGQQQPLPAAPAVRVIQPRQDPPAGAPPTPPTAA